MPTKRRVIPGRVHGRMTDNQRDHLSTGHYFWGDEEFRDEAHRRATWEANRATILAEWCFPGRRPVAMWEYDYGLSRCAWPREWTWPRPIESESEMVYCMLERGELEGCRFNGNNPIGSELAQIEADWLHEVRVALISGRGPVTIRSPLPTFGCPPWYYREHAPRVRAELLDRRDGS